MVIFELPVLDLTDSVTVTALKICLLPTFCCLAVFTC